MRATPSSMKISPAPTTAGMPQPRATTAAWLTMPPRAVRMPSRRLHAEHVVGCGLGAHEDDVLAPVAGFHRLVGGHGDAPARRTGRRRQAGGQQLAFGVVIVEAGVQVLRE